MPVYTNIAEKKDEIISPAIHHIGEMFSRGQGQYSPGYFNGEAGIILFLYYYCHYYCNADYSIAESRLNRLLTALADDCSIGPSFAEGVIGISLVLSHLRKKGFVSGVDYLPENVETGIFQHIYHCLDHKLDELFYGAGGGLFLFMYDWEHSRNHSLYEKLQTLSDIIFHRYETCPQSFFHLPFETGIAHGYGSWLIILSKLVKLGIRSEKNQVILDVLKRVYDEFLTADNKDIFFPRTILQSGDYIFWKRHGWCTGDISCLAALIQCYKNQQETERLNIAITMLKHLAKKFTPLAYNVHDSALCHGDSGLHVLFHWFNDHFPCKEFYYAQVLWLRRCLKSLDNSDGLLGFRKRYYDMNGILVISKETAILEGLAGIGLTFISYLANDYNWEDLFLLGNG